MADRDVVRSYIITFNKPLYEKYDPALRSRFHRTVPISPYAFLGFSPEKTRTIFEFVREVVGPVEAVFVARLERHVEAESFGMHAAAERDYGHKPSGRVLRSLNSDVGD